MLKFYSIYCSDVRKIVYFIWLWMYTQFETTGMVETLYYTNRRIFFTMNKRIKSQWKCKSVCVLFLISESYIFGVVNIAIQIILHHFIILIWDDQIQSYWKTTPNMSQIWYLRWSKWPYIFFFTRNTWCL